MKHRHVPHQTVIMARGHRGRNVRQHVARECNSVDAITAVANHHTFKSDHVPSLAVLGHHGPSGPIVPPHVVAPMSSGNDSTRVVARWTPIPSIATLIHARIMVPGQTGRPVHHHAVWAQ